MKATLLAILGGVLGIILVLVGGYAMLGGPTAEDLPFQPYRAEATQAEGDIPLHFSQIKEVELPLSKLSALACGPDNAIYAAGDGRVLALEPLGEPAWADEIETPPITALAVDPADNSLWLAAGREFSRRGADGSWQRIARLPDGDSLITSLALQGDRLALADSGKRQIHILSKRGELQHSFGRDTGNNEIELLAPSPSLDLLWLPGGRLLINNPGRRRILTVQADGSQLSAWGESSIEPYGFCGCCNPTHLARLPDGSIITSEKGIVRVKMYSEDGNFLGFVARPSSLKRSGGSRPDAYDLAAGTDGRVILGDPVTATIRIYKRRGGMKQP